MVTYTRCLYPETQQFVSMEHEQQADEQPGVAPAAAAAQKHKHTNASQVDR